MPSRGSGSLSGKFVIYYWLCLIIGLAAVTRIYGISHAALWFDEAYSVLTSREPISSIWTHSANDVHPPLYYMLLHGWAALFGDSIVSVRALSALLGVITVVLGVWLTRLIATRRAAILAGLLIAVLPIAVRYSQEARMYALLAVLSVAATLVLIYWVRNPQRNGYACGYALLIAAGLYTHYFAGPCVISHWLYILFLRTRGHPFIKLPAWWLANGAVILIYLPWVPSLIAQFEATNGLYWTPPVTLFLVLSQLWQFLTLTDGYEGSLLLFASLPLIVTLLTAIPVKADHDQYRFSVLLAVYTFVPLLIVALASLKVPLYWTRYFLPFAIGLPLIMAIALDLLLDLHRWVARICLAGLLAVQGVGLFNVYSGQFKLNNPEQRLETRIDAAVAYVAEHWTSGDRILVYGLHMLPGTLYYNQTGTVPYLYTADSLGGRPYNRFAGEFWLGDGSVLFADSYESLPKDTQRVWFIYDVHQSTVAVPGHWLMIDHFSAGDTQLWLYAVKRTGSRQAR